jgi:hypothetical protein
MSNLGDLAESVAAELSTGESMPPMPSDDPLIEGEEVLDEDDQLDSERGYVFANKIRFSWKTDDQEILDRIRKSADQVFQSLFAESIEIIDRFYLGMRVPLGVGPDGRPIWQLDEATSRPVERIDQLTGQDIDQAILNLERILLTITPQVNQLRLEALMAQNSAKDSFDDAWPASGIAGERQSRANTKSRVERWHGFFRYYVYSTANTFYQEVKQFSRKLENIRYRQMQSQG